MTIAAVWFDQISVRRIFVPATTTKDGIEIYYEDWGKGRPVVLSHGWPLSADDRDNQMLFFLNHGYRVSRVRRWNRESQFRDLRNMRQGPSGLTEKPVNFGNCRN